MNSTLLDAAAADHSRTMLGAYGVPSGAPVSTSVDVSGGLRVAPTVIPVLRVESVLGARVAPTMSLPQVESVFGTAVRHLVDGPQDFDGAPIAGVKVVDGPTGVPPRGRPV